jgi:hypothetical protein
VPQRAALLARKETNMGNYEIGQLRGAWGAGFAAGQKEVSSVDDGPVKHLKCDHCGGEIACIQHAWIEWFTDADYNITRFRVVHHRMGSPRLEGCYVARPHGGLDTEYGICFDLPATHFAGEHMAFKGKIKSLPILQSLRREFKFAESIAGIESVLQLEASVRYLPTAPQQVVARDRLR